MGLLSDILEHLIQTPENLGSRGESRISTALKWANFWGYRGLQLRNVYLPKEGGGTSEVDLLYITAKGIFVIESKNYAGYIFGNEKNEYWTRTLYRGKDAWGRSRVEKDRFYNPIWQNKGHVKALQNYLKENVPFYSLIVFSDLCEFKHLDYDRSNTVVCYRGQLSSVFAQAWNSRPDVLTDIQIEGIHERLFPLTQLSEAEKQEHVSEIRTKLEDREHCPRCGGKLVLRTARAGPNAGKQFYGCSRYPQCRYTRNLGPE